MRCEAGFGVVVGLRAEAALLPGLAVACTGGDPVQAEAQAARLLAEGARGLLSFGLAGGLAPGLRPGRLVVGSAVAIGESVLFCEDDWWHGLHDRLPDAACGLVLGGDGVAATPTDKRRLNMRCQALAVDLESAAVARACAAAGKPFAVLRAIADPAQRGIPEVVLGGLDRKGRMRAALVLGRLLWQPEQLPAVVRLGMDARTALRSLARAVPAVAPAFGLQPA